MRKNHKLISAIAVMFVFACIQVSSVRAEEGSPMNVVKSFAQAYFILDSSMTEYLNKDALASNMADRYLEKKALEAYNCGYNITYMQKFPTNMNIKVIKQSDSSATIEFDAITIRNINPVYRMIGSLIGVLEEYKVHDIITLVKEDGGWKIAPGVFEM
jgi:hypothetical protein